MVKTRFAFGITKPKIQYTPPPTPQRQTRKRPVPKKKVDVSGVSKRKSTKSKTATGQDKDASNGPKSNTKRKGTAKAADNASALAGEDGSGSAARHAGTEQEGQPGASEPSVANTATENHQPLVPRTRGTRAKKATTATTKSKQSAGNAPATEGSSLSSSLSSKGPAAVQEQQSGKLARENGAKNAIAETKRAKNTQPSNEESVSDVHRQAQHQPPEDHSAESNPSDKNRSKRKATARNSKSKPVKGGEILAKDINPTEAESSSKPTERASPADKRPQSQATSKTINNRSPASLSRKKKDVRNANYRPPKDHDDHDDHVIGSDEETPDIKGARKKKKKQVDPVFRPDNQDIDTEYDEISPVSETHNGVQPVQSHKSRKAGDRKAIISNLAPSGYTGRLTTPNIRGQIMFNQNGERSTRRSRRIEGRSEVPDAGGAPEKTAPDQSEPRQPHWTERTADSFPHSRTRDEENTEREELPPDVSKTMGKCKAQFEREARKIKRDKIRDNEELRARRRKKKEKVTAKLATRIDMESNDNQEAHRHRSVSFKTPSEYNERPPSTSQRRRRRSSTTYPPREGVAKSGSKRKTNAGLTTLKMNFPSNRSRTPSAPSISPITPSISSISSISVTSSNERRRAKAIWDDFISEAAGSDTTPSESSDPDSGKLNLSTRRRRYKQKWLDPNYDGPDSPPPLDVPIPEYPLDVENPIYPTGPLSPTAGQFSGKDWDRYLHETRGNLKWPPKFEERRQLAAAERAAASVNAQDVRGQGRKAAAGEKSNVRKKTTAGKKRKTSPVDVASPDQSSSEQRSPAKRARTPPSPTARPRHSPAQSQKPRRPERQKRNGPVTGQKRKSSSEDTSPHRDTSAQASPAKRAQTPLSLKSKPVDPSAQGQRSQNSTSPKTPSPMTKLGASLLMFFSGGSSGAQNERNNQADESVSGDTDHNAIQRVSNDVDAQVLGELNDNAEEAEAKGAEGTESGKAADDGKVQEQAGEEEKKEDNEAERSKSRRQSKSPHEGGRGLASSILDKFGLGGNSQGS